MSRQFYAIIILSPNTSAADSYFATAVNYSGTSYYLFWPFVVCISDDNVINQMHVSHGQDNTTTTDIDESSQDVADLWDEVMADGGGTSAVGSYDTSPAGCYDMAGNAYEYTRE